VSGSASLNSQIIRLKQVDHIKSEVRILTSISHPYIVNLLGHLQDERRMYLLFEYVPGGELFSYLRRESRFPNDQARFYAAEIALAFEYLHSMNIVYRDLKVRRKTAGAGACAAADGCLVCGRCGGTSTRSGLRQRQALGITEMPCCHCRHPSCSQPHASAKTTAASDISV
jgi:serine/threonine protein kinase